MKRELRSKSVGTKVSEAELRVLESRAERAGLTLSEWVRDVLLGSSVEMGTLAAERAILGRWPTQPGLCPIHRSYICSVSGDALHIVISRSFTPSRC